MKNQINPKENQIVFWLNSKTYPLEAIYSTAYVFLDRAYVYLDGDPAKRIVVSLKSKEKLNKKQLEVLTGEFHNELLNYLLRVEIAKRNKKIRDFVVGTALVSTLTEELLTQPAEIETSKDDSWIEDPLGIAVPWEEKFGKKSKVKKKRKK